MGEEARGSARSLALLAHVSGCSRGVRDDSRVLFGEQIAGLDSG